MSPSMEDQIDLAYIDTLRTYFRLSGNRHQRIVDFSSDKPSQFFKHSELIEHGSAKFMIVDSFNGTHPFVFSHKSLVQNIEIVPFLAGILLDSQVVQYFHKYVVDEETKFRSTEWGIATHKLLHRVAEYSLEGWDFNGFFPLCGEDGEIRLSGSLPSCPSI